MPAVSFFCPSFFRPTTHSAPPLDPAVLEVARAIYFGGRTDGLQGLEAMAHLIQNRMNNPAFASDALSVVSTGGDLGQRAPHEPISPGQHEKQLFDRANSMAAQLLYPPYRLTCRDPTGGRLYSDLHRADSASNADASPGQGNANSPRESVRSDELSDADEISVPPSPRPVLPVRSRKPFFLREQNTNGVNKRPYVQGGGNLTPTSTGDSPSITFPSSGSSVESTRSATATPPPPHAGDQPVRSTTPIPLGPPSSSRPNPSAAFAANGSAASATSGSRLLPRLGRGPRGAGPANNVQLGPADNDGYRDMILPCGLYQDEVIALMYRDISPEDFEKLSKLDERLPKRNTAPRNLINQLPRVAAKDCGATECSVCLGSFAPHQSVVKLPCAHSFHHACISKWLTQCKNTCPLCSAPITSEASASSAGSGAASSSALRTCMRAL